MKRIAAAALTVGLFTLAPNAHATHIITMTFSGHVSPIDSVCPSPVSANNGCDRVGLLASAGIQAGDPFDGVIVYDADTPQQFPGSNPAFYQAATQFTFTVHATTASGPVDYLFGDPVCSPAQGNALIQIWDSSQDGFAAGVSGNLQTCAIAASTPSDPSIKNGSYFDLLDSTATAYSTNALPTTFDLSKFNTHKVGFSVFYDANPSYFGGVATTDFTLWGNIESIAPAPPPPAPSPALPGSLVALTAVLLGALGARLAGAKRSVRVGSRPEVRSATSRV
jgi:hypothetical protein